METSVAALSGIGGAILAPLMIVFAFLAFVVVWIVNIVVWALVWIVSLFGVISSGTLSDGVLPDPYFTYAVEGIVLAAIGIGAFILLIGLKGDDSNSKTKLRRELSWPLLTLTVPAVVLTYLYAVLDTNAGLPAVPAPPVGSPILFSAALFAALIVTNRSRRLISEAGKSTRIPYANMVIGFAGDIATWSSIIGVGLAAFHYVLVIGGMSPTGDSGDAGTMLGLMPTPSTLITGMVGIAGGAAVLAVLYYGLSTVLPHR